MGRWNRSKDPKFCERGFDDPTSMDLGGTLSQKLIPVADRVRNLFTKFGLRPYKIRVVRIRWSGGHRGRGVPSVEKAIDILPTPLVEDLSTLTDVLEPVGIMERGVVTVSEISGRFTGEQLQYADESGQPPASDEEVFYEIEYAQPGEKESAKRRFTLRGVPFYNAMRFQWLVRLERSHEDRAVNGDPR